MPKPSYEKKTDAPSIPAKSRAENLRPKNFARVFETFGVAFATVSSSGQAVAEECPWCGKDRFSVNITTGQYDCKKCQAKGNVTTYLTWLHGEFLNATTRDHYLSLKAKRGIASQTLKSHGLAFDPIHEQWLIPFRSTNGSVINIMRYYPDGRKPNKYMLPELPTALYGMDRLAKAGKDKAVLLHEGPFDAIALDYSLGSNNRQHYVVMATPGTFIEAWAEYFRGRKVRAFYDNDKGGEQHRERVRKLLGESGIAEELRLLRWPAGTPEGFDVNDLVRKPEFADKPVLGWLIEHSPKVVAEPKLIVSHGRRKPMEERPIDWIWTHHLRCGTYASFSGRAGTFKSTIAGELAARYTTGRPMPTMKDGKLNWLPAGMPAGSVLYVHAEDDRDAAENRFEWAGGDFARWKAMPARIKDGDPLNILHHLKEIEQILREHDIRFVIIDGQNSVVGSPNISTDMGARSNVTNPLHQFAQRLNVCVLGIRNEDAEGRALGPQSMGDLGRCVMRVEELEPRSEPPYCILKFPKVQDTARSNYPDIPYSVEDKGGANRKILWGKARPKATTATEAATGKRTGQNRI